MDFLYIVSREMKCLVCFSGGLRRGLGWSLLMLGGRDTVIA